MAPVRVRIFVRLAVFFTAFLAGCGGGGSSPPTLTSIALTPARFSAPAGTNVQLAATGTYSDQSHQDLTADATWSSSSSTVATVAATTGQLTANSVGSAQISASFQGVTGVATVTVTPPALASIVVIPGGMTLAIGMPQSYTAIGAYTDGITKNLTQSVTWSASNTAVVAVSNAAGSPGTATPLSIGTANIVAKLSGVSGETPVTVVPGGYVYVTNMTDYTISQYYIGPGGKLVPLTPAVVATGGYPQGIYLDPNGMHAYVAAIASGGTVWQYAIGPGGGLTPLSPASLSTLTNPRAVSGDPSGRYVYVGTLGGICGFLAGTDGTLTSLSSTCAPTGTYPFSISVAPTGSYAYVVNQGDSTVSQYSLATTGSLTPLAPATVATGLNPSAVTLDPSGRFAYVTNTNGPSVSQFSIAPGGGLAPLNPATVAAGPSSGSVAVDPSGRWAYVANFYGGTLSQYSIGSDGTLSPLTPATVAAGTNPGSITADASGQYIYVADTGSPVTLQFAIGSDGTLAPLNPPTVRGGNEAFAIASTAVVRLTSISVNPGTLITPAGMTQQFTALGGYSNTQSPDLTNRVLWVSSDTTVVTIAAGGLATVSGSAPSGATATISAYFGAVRGTSTVVVQ